MGLALGYEDLNDHDQLRHDPLLALVCGRKDITGQDRREPDERGVPLAGKSTLNRLELTPVGANSDSRYKKVTAHIGRLQETLVDLFIRMRAKQEVPEELVLDLDATDDPVHGDQLGKFFHGYYKSYCFLPLYIFCGDWPLLALLRPANIDASAGRADPHSRGQRLLSRADHGLVRGKRRGLPAGTGEERASHGRDRSGTQDGEGAV